MLNPRTQQMLAHMKTTWETGTVGIGYCADFLGIEPEALAARVAAGQALALPDPEDADGPYLLFTPYQVMFNLLADRLLRYGFAVGQCENPVDEKPYIYAGYVLKNILSEPHHTSAAIGLSRAATGQMMATVFESGAIDPPYMDAALIVPLGKLTMRLASALHLRDCPQAYR